MKMNYLKVKNQNYKKNLKNYKQNLKNYKNKKNLKKLL